MRIRRGRDGRETRCSRHPVTRRDNPGDCLPDRHGEKTFRAVQPRREGSRGGGIDAAPDSEAGRKPNPSPARNVACPGDDGPMVNS